MWLFLPSTLSPVPSLHGTLPAPPPTGDLVDFQACELGVGVGEEWWLPEAFPAGSCPHPVVPVCHLLIPGMILQRELAQRTEGWACVTQHVSN